MVDYPEQGRCAYPGIIARQSLVDFCQREGRILESSKFNLMNAYSHALDNENTEGIETFGTALSVVNGKQLGLRSVCEWAREAKSPNHVGKSLVEKIRDDLDEAFRDWKQDQTEGNESFAEGIAHALGVLRGTSADEEWHLAEERSE